MLLYCKKKQPHSNSEAKGCSKVLFPSIDVCLLAILFICLWYISWYWILFLLLYSAAPTQIRVTTVQYKHVHNKRSALFQKEKNLRAKQTRQEDWQGKSRLRTLISQVANWRTRLWSYSHKQQQCFVTEIGSDRLAFYIVYPEGHGTSMAEGRMKSQSPARHSEMLTLFVYQHKILFVQHKHTHYIYIL